MHRALRTHSWVKLNINGNNKTGDSKIPEFNRHKRSLGGLRSNPNRKDNILAPDGIGRMLVHRDLVTSLSAQLQKTKQDYVEVSIASWRNKKKLANGTVDEFLTIEINALSQKDARWWNPDNSSVSTLDDFFK